jgi:hypothetical protein
MLVCVLLRVFARETAGAACTRLSLRPLNSKGGNFPANLARNARRDREAVFAFMKDACAHSPSSSPAHAGDSWRVLNFELSPFCGSPPVELVNENCREAGGDWRDKSLAVWRLVQIGGRASG